MKKLSITLLMIIIPLTLIIASITFLSQTSYFYLYEFEKLETIHKAGIDASSQEVTGVIVDFIKGNTEEFQMATNVNGVKQNLYTSKEQLHMKDVRDLVQKGNIVSLIGISIILIFYVALLLLKEKETLRLTCKMSMMIYGIILITFLIIGVTDFREGFNVFHEVLFNNDLWILNPNEDILLMLMPIEFFIDALIVSLVLVTIIMILLGVITWNITKRRNML